MTAAVDFDWNGTRWRLLPRGAAFWVDQSLGMVADLHLGRAQTHRRFGLYLPDGGDGEDLAHLSELGRRAGWSQLLILGDVFHGLGPGDVAVVDSFLRWRDRQPFEVSILQGNHDRMAQELFPGRGLNFVGEEALINGFRFTHLPAEGVLPNVCGHLHPGLRLKDAAGCVVSCKAFWWSERQLVLPGFGSTTRLRPLDRGRTWRVFATGEDQVFEV